MARNKGTFQFAANFEVKLQDLLDPRGGVTSKAELINKETFPYSGDTIYMKEGMLVTVQEEQSIYMLIDLSKITASDYSGWKRMDAAAAQQIEVVDNLESDSSDAALSAKQGKELKSQIDSAAQKLTKVYTYQGSKATFAELPTDAKEGDVWNVEEAHEGHPSGTNWAWTGTEWDALAGNIDLSNYLNKDEVAAAIKVETDRATSEEQRLAELIEANTTLGNEAKSLASDNKTQLESVTKSLGDINLLLNGNDNPDDEIEDQVGIVGRLTIVEEKNTNQDSRLEALEKLVTGGGTGEEGETDQTLLQKVNANTLAITQLQQTVGDSNSGLVKAVNILNSDSNVEGSVDYKISQAFAWIDVE